MSRLSARCEMIFVKKAWRHRFPLTSSDANTSERFAVEEAVSTPLCAHSDALARASGFSAHRGIENARPRVTVSRKSRDKSSHAPLSLSPTPNWLAACRGRADECQCRRRRTPDGSGTQALYLDHACSSLLHLLRERPARSARAKRVRPPEGERSERAKRVAGPEGTEGLLGVEGRRAEAAAAGAHSNSEDAALSERALRVSRFGFAGCSTTPHRRDSSDGLFLLDRT